MYWYRFLSVLFSTGIMIASSVTLRKTWPPVAEYIVVSVLHCSNVGSRCSDDEVEGRDAGTGGGGTGSADGAGSISGQTLDLR